MANTNLRFHQIEKPQLNDLRETLQASIDQWDARAKRFKERGGMHLEKFRDLSAIPENKRYGTDHSSTLEQRLSFKIYKHQTLSSDEEAIIKDLQGYYAELNTKLAVLDYSSFMKQDLLEFKNYIHYAFNFHFMITNQLEVTQVLYHLVVNEHVSGHNSSLLHSCFLSYPPLPVLQKIGKYNRARTCDTTLLYLTESVDTALKELKPPRSKLTTIGLWALKHKRHFTSYPIEHHQAAAKVNEEVAKGFSAMKAFSEAQHPLFAGYIENYLNLVAREYSKPLNYHYAYVISAILSENILDMEDTNPDFNYECIVYPAWVMIFIREIWPLKRT